MEIATATTTTTATTTGTATKTPEADIETPTRIQPNKPLSFSNGVLKRHHSFHHHHHHHITATPVVVSYKECLKNHAASLGSHALDGCGEFMPSPTATPTDPTSLKCAACGCHRNFHRREPEEQQPQLPVPTATTTHVIEYQPHHRHHPPPPPPPRSPGSHSPPPISSSYYPSAPHMLLALSAGLSGPPPPPPAEINTPSSMSLHATTMATPTNPNGRKRFRTRFSQGQKEKMHQFAESVGWKMQKSNEEMVADFCNEIGVDRGVLKVWMHNNKNTFGKKDANGSANNLDNNTNTHNNNDENQLHHQNDSSANVATNGSSSSS